MDGVLLYDDPKKAVGCHLAIAQIFKHPSRYGYPLDAVAVKYCLRVQLKGSCAIGPFRGGRELAVDGVADLCAHVVAGLMVSGLKWRDIVERSSRRRQR